MMKKLPSNLGCEFDENAKCPKWDKFIEEVLPRASQRAILREFLREAILRENTKQEKMLVLLGAGSNGKSVITETIRSIVGLENYSGEELIDLTFGKKVQYSISSMNGKLINFCSEITAKTTQSAIFKEIVSREHLVAREPYGRPFIAKDIPLLICELNELPEMPDGCYRRLQLIKFGVEIPKEKQNPNLAEELKEELSGILNWILND